MDITKFLEEFGIEGLNPNMFSAFDTIYTISGAIGLILYIVQAIAIYKMAKNIGINNSWLAFIPIANIFVFGKIASKYIKRDGTSSANFGVVLLVLEILSFIAAAALVVFLVIALISVLGFAQDAITNDTTMTLEMFSSVIPVIILYVVTLLISLAYRIIYYVALWRVFSIFSSGTATLFTVLSILFNFLPAIFLFAIRNSNPCFTYSQRMGFEEF